MLLIEMLVVVALLGYTQAYERDRIADGGTPFDFLLAVVATVLALSFYSWQWNRLGAFFAYAALAGAFSHVYVIFAGLGGNNRRLELKRRGECP